METSTSLLERLRTEPAEADWRRLDDLYRPWLSSWLRRHTVLDEHENEDIVQEIMSVLFRELPRFRRQRTGSFRRWLREITVHRVPAWDRRRQRRPRMITGLAPESALGALSDPSSELSHQWDEDHDWHVLRRLLDLIEPQFEEKTLAAFRRVVFEERSTAEVAAELGMTPNAVMLAKSRVLRRLRQEAEELLD